MPVDWKQLSGFERAEMILENISGLTNEDIQAIYDEWSQLTFESTVRGVIQSEAELQRIGVRYTLKRVGKWEQELERRRRNLGEIIET